MSSPDAGAEFKALWDRIKHKATCRAVFDDEDLLEQSGGPYG